MRKFIISLCFILSIIQATSQVRYSINEAWLFSKDVADTQPANLKDTNGEIISFPHTWNTQDVLDDEAGYYRGIGWYRKNIFIDRTAENKTIYLYFEGANQETDVYINGHHVGNHKGGYTMFCFDISSYIQVGKDNHISIRVDNSRNKNIPPLSADFTFFGGVYRDVYLDVRNNIHISPIDKASSGIYISTPLVSESEAKIDIKALLNNRNNKNETVIIENQVIDPNGKVVKQSTKNVKLTAKAENKTEQYSFHIPNPLLWSTESPQLYTLRTIVKDTKGQKILDESLNTFGLRWFNFDADKGFFLNGKHVKLIGTSRHQCYLNKGNALEDEYHIRDVKLLKDMGGNFLRVSHYPQDPLVLDMCDKLGIVASVEIPIVNAITESDEFLDNSLTMADEMVKQSYNHPSLVVWSYMNEVMLRSPYKQNDPEYTPYCTEVNRQAKVIEKLIRELDPLRYTLIPFHGSMKAYKDAGLFDVPMMIGWNLYQGWYGGKLEDFDKYLLDYKKQYPHVPTIITEYGADVDTRIHSSKPERFDFSVEYGDLYHEHYLKTILEHDFITGANIWNLNDFHSELRSNAVPHINSKGITELDRTPKNTYYLYKAHLIKEPFVKIASSDWKNRAGIETSKGISEQTIKIYSNRENVKVYHNSKLLGSVKIENYIGTISVPFTEGDNFIEARIEEDNKSDIYQVSFNILSQQLDNTFSELNVLLGSTRSFEDKESQLFWMPEKEYEKSSWGFIGGKAFRPKTQFGSLPAADINVLGTDLDPIFQTQRVGIEAFKADVPDGKYAIYLYWTDFNKNEKGEALAYNLGNDSQYENVSPRVFHVSINSTKVMSSYDIPKQVGTQRAIIKKFEFNVTDEKGLTISLSPLKGETILNAIRIVKLN